MRKVPRAGKSAGWAAPRRGGAGGMGGRPGVVRCAVLDGRSVGRLRVLEVVVLARVGPGPGPGPSLFEVCF